MIRLFSLSSSFLHLLAPVPIYTCVCVCVWCYVCECADVFCSLVLSCCTCLVLSCSSTGQEHHICPLLFLYSLSCFTSTLSPHPHPPKVRPGVFDVSLLSGSSGLPLDSHFLSALSFLCLLLFLSCRFSVNCPFFCLFPRKFPQHLFVRRLLCMALVEQLGDDSW